MKYLALLVSAAIGFIGPAAFLNLAIYFDIVLTDPEAPVPEGFHSYYMGGYMWMLILSLPFAIASLFTHNKARWRSYALWAPACLPCLYALGALIYFSG